MLHFALSVPSSPLNRPRWQSPLAGSGAAVLEPAAAQEGALQRRGVPAVVRRHLVGGEMEGGFLYWF